MATMEDVAKAAKVSRATVSRVLSNYPSIKPETRSNVMYWVRELNYEPNMVAQNLAGNNWRVVFRFIQPTLCVYGNSNYQGGREGRI